MSVVAGVMLSSTAMGESPKLKAAWKLHQKECARCFGDQGKGDGKTSSMLKVKPVDRGDSARMETLADENLTAIISGGGQAVSKSILMPAFGKKRSAEDIRGLARLVGSMHEKQWRGPLGFSWPHYHPCS